MALVLNQFLHFQRLHR